MRAKELKWLSDFGKLGANKSKLLVLHLWPLNELKSFVVHRNEFAWLSDVVQTDILFEVVESEVKQVIDLAEQDKLIVVFRSYFKHKVLHFMLQSCPLKLFE